MVALFSSFTYRNLREQMISQILQDNRSMGEHLFKLFNDEFYFNKTSEEQIAFLQTFSDEIMLPNGGFVCALSPDGGVVAFPGLTPESDMSIGSFTIHDEENEYSGTFANLEKNRPFGGILKEPDAPDQIIYSQPLGETPLRLNIHQNMEEVDGRIKAFLYPSIVIGILVSIFGSIMVYLLSNRIVKSYESQLELLNADLEEVSSERKQLLRVLSHDLSNPLNIIDMATTFLEEDLEEESGDDEQLSENVEMIRTGVSKAIDIISMHREIMALEDKKSEITLQKILLDDSLSEMKKVLKHRFEEKNIIVETNIETDITVKVEPISFLNSVLNNIVTNAIKFSFPRSTITITAAREGTMTLISISDQGIGMPHSLIDDLFNVNASTHRAGTADETGTGFGMPIMKRFVELYKGTVTVESSEGKVDARVHGTTFHLRIPSE